MRKVTGILILAILLVNVSSAYAVNPITRNWRNLLKKVRTRGKEQTPVPARPRAKSAPRKAISPKKPLRGKAPKAKPSAERKPATTVRTAMNKKELLVRIKDILEDNEEIADFVPELRIARNAAGKITKIEYKIEGVFEDIKGLSEEALMVIYKRITNERVRLNYERIQRQLEAAKQAREANTRVGAPPPRPPRAPSMPPKVPSVPKVPARRR